MTMMNATGVSANYYLYDDKWKSKLHWRYDANVLFPRKLWEAVNSGGTLVTWNETGDAVNVIESEFEARIVNEHLGLVENPTFANFRRQFREYGFNWSYNMETDQFTFWHRYFQRNREDLIELIVTKRKRIQRGDTNQFSPAAALLCEAPVSDKHRHRRINRIPIKSRGPRKAPLSRSGLTANGLQRSSSSMAMTMEQQQSVDDYGYTSSSPSSMTQTFSTAQTSLNFNPAVCGSTPPPSSRKNHCIRVDNMCQCAQYWSNWRDASGCGDETWNECIPWLIQQDARLSEEHNIACLQYAAARVDHHNVDIPIYFFGDAVNYNNGCMRLASVPVPFHSDYPIIEIVPNPKYKEEKDV